MKKLFKISAAAMALSIAVTSVGMTALADESTQKILLYEDMENIDLTAFGTGTASSFGATIGTATQQYLKTARNTSYTLTNTADSSGNKMIKLFAGDRNSYNDHPGTWASVFMRFDDTDSDGEWDAWALDSENLNEELIVSYDLSVSEADWQQPDVSRNSRFYGAPEGINSEGAYAAILNKVSRGGVFSAYTDEETSELKMRFGMRTTDGANWDNNNNIKTTGLDFDERANFTFKFAKDGTYRIYASNGKKVSTNYTTLTAPLAYINSVEFIVSQGYGINIDDVRAYTVPTGTALEVTSNDKTDVALTDKLELTLNGYIPEYELSKIVVKNGDEVIDSSEYTVSVTDNSSTVESTVAIKFNEKMSFGTTYSVVVPATLVDEARKTLAEEATVNFTTLEAPSFDVGLSVTSGGEAVTALSGAAGKTVLCDVDVNHTTTRDSSGVIFVGLYDAEGNVVAYGSTDKAYTPNETDEIKVSLNVPADTTGMSIKAFACEGIAKIDNIFSKVATLQ